MNDTIETNAAWKTLYKIGGVAALIAVFVFRRYLGAEIMAFHGFGILSVPQAMPVSAADWFAVFHSNPLTGFTLLEGFDLIEYALVGVMFLAVTAVLRKANQSILTIALAGGLVGIAIYFASNQAFAMLTLSERYAAAATDAQRSVFLAAGEALLAMDNPGALHQGAGIYTGIGLVLVAGLLISMVMLRSNIFGKFTAVAGMLANGFALTYFLVLAFAPELLVLPFVISAPFRVIWYFLIALKLFQLGKEAN